MNNIENYPVILRAEHISEILGISKHRTYEIMKLKGFPVTQIGNLKFVNRESFFKWLDNQSYMG